MLDEFKWRARRDYAQYVLDYGYEPRYAECYIAYQGAAPELMTIALFEYDILMPEEDDDEVFFYCKNLEELLALNEDFEVIRVNDFFVEL